ncbi:D-alanyl-D-alanine carboxypeptidase/D-alanyl-D-alanine endopeptidase [Thioflexithrix psekupsensis]|uniref:D-alanyl-D-alanine carboxypeptidase/D-alanyl-D-alanine-endopeptidase n=1 Tax=Thioflexithrix psekupsensis TaxID=1570016 RepID=A0A251X9Y4_9GAMM|nr:D-alanyl-D-alanine carboxypeptidase/D-alanyl-D-alanine-endopeptidase [Thioflexithrix psekupsensis]OUD14994.1 D-alanyl-D-alanine carboxypeptidase/D-alanyl-D-alanine-endopeptidase [Thioflexithrix psekupsensis]
MKFFALSPVIYGVIFLLLTTLFQTQFVQAQADLAALRQEIDAALNSRCLNRNETSIHITSLSDGRTLYDLNGATPLLPASIMKIVTTAAALHYLGPEYRFRTEVLHTGQREGNTIFGDLVLRGRGDPTLTTDALANLVRRLKASGITEIQGRLLADNSFFDQQISAPSWETDRSQRAYDANIGALSVNFNTIAVRVLPGQRAGSAVNAWLDPAPNYFELSNQAKTVNRGNDTISARRTSGEDTVQIRVTGQLPVGSGERVIFINVENPARYAIETFRSLLNEAGIRVLGSSEIVPMGVQGQLLYEHVSQPLSLILKELNTFSNNFIAEQVLKTIAAFHYTGKSATHLDGLELIAQFLREIGVNTRGVMLADGSGLSRRNQFTAEAMTDLLQRMFGRFDIGPDFIASLRVMGAYGTHSRRLNNSPARARVRAKTGTLNRVSTLAGYVSNPQNQVFAFAFFLNSNDCGYAGADKIEDRMIAAIYNFTQQQMPLNSPLATQQY